MGSVTPDPVWLWMETHEWGRREFRVKFLREQNKYMCYMLVGFAVLALGDERPARHPATESVFAASPAAVAMLLQRTMGVGPKLAKDIISVALEVDHGGATHGLHKVAGRLEVSTRDPEWPNRPTVVD